MTLSLAKLVAATIHDVKNSLFALVTELETIAEQHQIDLDKPRGKLYAIAEELTCLLTLYRAESDLLVLAIADHDLRDFLDELRLTLDPLPRGIRLEIDQAAAEAIGTWAFDANLVRLALGEAIRNATRYAQEVIRVSINLAPTGGIVFTVADDGPGFPAALLDNTGPIASSESTGLGLSFLQTIAQAHRTPEGRTGSLQLSNDRGAVVRLFLP